MKYALIILALALSLPTQALAVSDPLAEVYAERADLQAAFDEEGTPVGTAAGFLMNLEDWARQYGWQEYPELAAYAPAKAPPSHHPTVPPSTPTISSGRYIVIDDATGAILLAEKAEQEWPIASITKLMTTKVAVDNGLDVGGSGSVRDTDDVGGAKLYVVDGTTFTIRDLLAATLVGSANNAANAVARLTGIERANFVTKMNTEAAALGLTHTSFVDPTGIELGNVSNAREVAYFAHKAFAHEHIRKFTGSTKAHIAALNDETYVRDIKNTNWLLYDPAYDDLYVTAGKTGFLNESGWNLVVRMHPMGEDTSRSLTIVVLGAAGRRESFDDAANLARWTWKNFTWE